MIIDFKEIMQLSNEILDLIECYENREDIEGHEHINWENALYEMLSKAGSVLRILEIECLINDDELNNYVSAANPEENYKKYYKDIEKKIIEDGYVPQTSMENLIKMIILWFDNDENYGPYDEELGCGGYGDSFTLEECFDYIAQSSGYEEFDYYIPEGSDVRD